MGLFKSAKKVLTTDISELVTEAFTVKDSKARIRLAINFFIARILVSLLNFGIPVFYEIASVLGQIGFVLLIYGVATKILESLPNFDLSDLISPKQRTIKAPIKQLPKDTSLSVDSSEIKIDSSGTIAEESSESSQMSTNSILTGYYLQVLRQSSISFMYSLIFAAIGFIVIVISIFPDAFQTPIGPTDRPDQIEERRPADKWPGLISGIVIEAVSALIFVQTNNARRTMIEFSEKIRLDRKLDESLELIDRIPNQKIQSKVKALLVLNFSGIVMKYDDHQILQQIINSKDDEDA